MNSLSLLSFLQGAAEGVADGTGAQQSQLPGILELLKVAIPLAAGWVLANMKYSLERRAAREDRLRVAYAEFGSAVERACIELGALRPTPRQHDDRVAQIVGNVRSRRFAVMAVEADREWREKVQGISDSVSKIGVAVCQPEPFAHRDEAKHLAMSLNPKLNSVLEDLAKRTQWK